MKTVCGSLCLTVLVAMSCAACAAPGGPSTDPLLRVRNTGAAHVAALVVEFPQDRITFGDVGPGTTTPHQPVPHGVFPYAAYHYELTGQPGTQPVIDWLGEAPLSGRAFTFVIDIDGSRPANERIRLVRVDRDQ